MEEIKRLDEAEKILEIPISYEEKGRKKGLEQGLKQGLAKGMEKGIRKVATQMLKEGVPVETIAKFTQLDKQKINKMKESLS